MSKTETLLPDTAAKKALNFTELHAAFKQAVEEAFQARDAQILRQSYDSFAANTDHDKKSPLDQAFREKLLFQLSGDVEDIGAIVRLSVEAVRMEIVSITIPVVLLGDIFETVTLDKCERIFRFVEDMVEVWKEEIFFTSCKNNILRMCNDLLRRLSRAQNTVFCGRILLFLSKFFPFSERSGLNIVSEFNLDNVTEYGDGKDLDDGFEEASQDIPIKIDYNLYCKFWSLQDFFRNPNQCYSKAQWKMFQAHAAAVLDSFACFKLEEPRLSSPTDNPSETNSIANDALAKAIDVEMKDLSDDTDAEIEQSITKSASYFAKFLTNPKLLSLQLSDANFRRSVLVQFLILFQYLQLTVKFKSESNTLTTAQTDFIKETEAKVYKLLEETPPNGKRFARTVQHMLSREEMWNNWKNEGCKEFKKPEEPPPAESNADTKLLNSKRLKRPLGDLLKEAHHGGKFFLGNDVLTRLWNYSPDNLQACKSEERNFLPSLESFLDGPHDKGDASFEWRALRLMARQSPHFFTSLNSPSHKISDYLDGVRKRLSRERQELLKLSQGSPLETSNNCESSMLFEEQVTVQETEQELEDEDDNTELEKVEDDKITHSKPMTASREHIEEIAPLIGDHWKKLGKKLGFTADELLFFETEHPDRDAACIAMLTNWFADDEDASLDNWAYTLEGLEINAASKAVKSLIERLTSKMETDEVEVLSD